MPKRPRDPNELAASIVAQATGEVEPAPVREKDPKAVATGREGGKARAGALTKKQRTAIAKKAAKARWAAKKTG
jgi:hypothetical protein